MSKAVKPIPDGYHTLTPYIMVKGAAEAIEFYKKAFGAKEMFRMPGPDGKTIGHAELKIGNSVLMLADDCAEANAHSPAVLKGTTFAFAMYVEDADAAFEQGREVVLGEVAVLLGIGTIEESVQAWVGDLLLGELAVLVLVKGEELGDEFVQQREFVAAPRWVIDGNYNSTVQVRLEAADTVVFMDLPTRVCLWGILSRQLRHGRGQNEQTGVYNRITGDVLRYVVGYRWKMRPRVLAKIHRHASGAALIMLTSRRQTRHFLRQVASSTVLSDLSPP